MVNFRNFGEEAEREVSEIPRGSYVDDDAGSLNR